MRTAMIGAGYVGLVSAACPADFGHQVTCIDTDEAKVAALRRGRMLHVEPGLDEIVTANAAAGRPHFESEVAVAGLTYVSIGRQLVLADEAYGIWREAAE